MSKTDEKRRLRSLITNEAKLKALTPVIDNVAWMKSKLDEAREEIKDTGVVIPYEKSNGQMVMRENPLFRGYEALWKSYMQGMARIIEAIPDEKVKEKEEEKAKTVLQLVRAKHA